jgi:hypothetical protein
MNPRMKCAAVGTPIGCARHMTTVRGAAIGAGMPCPSCNVSNSDNPPRFPTGFQRDESLDDE